MNKKMSKRQRDIKTKLMAAICMLLVSSIMMVTTTYAWFTLSTAPEVTGIQTSVGANGNLEMALLPTSGQLSDIESEAGDSTLPLKDRNVTWGNLVDLSDNVTYGLDKISLYPSALNTTADGKLADSPLQFPTYGADGRVSDLVANTFTGVYNGTSFSPDSASGVRAVGSASGMTDRQLSYRNAKGAAGSAKSYAAQLASQSLNSRGNALASIAIKKGTESDPTFTKDDIDTLQGIISDLTMNGGVLDQIETAYMQYILALSASKDSTDDAWMYVKSLVEAENATLSSVEAGLAEKMEVPSALATGIAKFNTTVAAVEQAQTLLNGLEKDGEYTWAEIKDILGALANPDAMEINGIKAGEITQGENMNALVNSVLGNSGVIVTMTSGGGVYADIADQTENFTADIKIEKIVYGSQTFGPLPAKMKTEATSSYLGNIGTAVEEALAPDGGDAGSVPITDMYGYIIDLAFRTNASSSNLVLQKEAVDRIYTNNAEGVEVGEETTMGHGANMTFKSVNPSFSNEKVINLMKAIRVVFFDPTSGEIIKYALLDTANTSTTTDGGIKADLVLYVMGNGAATTSYYTDTVQEAGISYTVYYEESTRTTPFCRSYTEEVDVDGTSTTVTKWQVASNTTDEGTNEMTTTWGEASETQPADIPGETVEGDATLVRAEDNTIMPLIQNTATKLSVLVYLDGETITNADVAASGTQSVIGEMNLQFSSDGNLTPMNYTPLMNQGSTATPEAPEGE